MCMSLSVHSKGQQADQATTAWTSVLTEVDPTASNTGQKCVATVESSQLFAVLFLLQRIDCEVVHAWIVRLNLDTHVCHLHAKASDARQIVHNMLGV